MATQQIKDILNAEVPKPSFVLSPSVPAPLSSGVTVTRNGQDNVARTLDPYSGKFEHVPEDTPRVYGDDQSLLVEAAGRTNQVLNSSDASNTKQAGINGATVSDASAELLEGVDADSKRIESQGDAADFRQHDVGAHSGNTETLRFEVEEGSSGFFRVVVISFSDENYSVEVDFSAESHNVRSDVENHIDSIEKRFTDNGPNGSKKVDLRIRHSGFTSGANRFLSIGPNSDTAGEDFIHYHTQLEEAPNASSPIVTQGSPTTRAADEYSIFSGGQPSWWNPNEGTFFVQFENRVYNQNNSFGNPVVNILSNSILQLTGGGISNVVFSNGGSRITIVGAAPPFTKVSAAISFDNSTRRLSVSGTSKTASHDGSVLSVSDLGFSGFGGLIASINDLVYYPRALPESTLNTLTT